MYLSIALATCFSLLTASSHAADTETSQKSLRGVIKRNLNDELENTSLNLVEENVANTDDYKCTIDAQFDATTCSGTTDKIGLPCATCTVQEGDLSLSICVSMVQAHVLTQAWDKIECSTPWDHAETDAVSEDVEVEEKEEEKEKEEVEDVPDKDDLKCTIEAQFDASICSDTTDKFGLPCVTCSVQEGDHSVSVCVSMVQAPVLTHAWDKIVCSSPWDHAKTDEVSER